MNKISVNEFSTYRWSLFEDVLYYSKHNYSSIGLWRSKVDDLGAEETFDLLHEMRLSVSSVNWAGGFTGGDGRSFNQALDDAIEAIRFASAVNADCLILHPGSRNNHTPKHLRRILNSALEQLVPVARDYDLSLALEPVFFGSFREWSFLKTLDDYLEVISEYPALDLGLVLDLFHVGMSQQLANLIPSLLDRIHLVQLADKRREIHGEDNRCQLGDGMIPVNSWIELLIKSGYQGAFELELHGFDMESVDYESMLESSIRPVQQQLQQLHGKPQKSRTE